jgi:hypothetical protein
VALATWESAGDSLSSDEAWADLTDVRAERKTEAVKVYEVCVLTRPGVAPRSIFAKGGTRSKTLDERYRAEFLTDSAQPILICTTASRRFTRVATREVTGYRRRNYSVIFVLSGTITEKHHVVSMVQTRPSILWERISGLHIHANPNLRTDRAIALSVFRRLLRIPGELTTDSSNPDQFPRVSLELTIFDRKRLRSATCRRK